MFKSKIYYWYLSCITHFPVLHSLLGQQCKMQKKVDGLVEIELVKKLLLMLT